MVNQAYVIQYHTITGAKDIDDISNSKEPEDINAPDPNKIMDTVCEKLNITRAEFLQAWSPTLTINCSNCGEPILCDKCKG